MQLTREAIQRMVGDRMGGGGTGGGGGISAAMLAGYATESWVNDNYLSIEFFSKLFKAYDSAATPNEVQPNDTESTITNIKAMFGFWTEQYISALGQNGTAQGSTIAVSDLVDVQLSSPSNGQVLMWDATNSKWVNGTVQGGGSFDRDDCSTTSTPDDITDIVVFCTGLHAKNPYRVTPFTLAYKLAWEVLDFRYDTRYGMIMQSQSGFPTSESRAAKNRYYKITTSQSSAITLYLPNLTVASGDLGVIIMFDFTCSSTCNLSIDAAGGKTVKWRDSSFSSLNTGEYEVDCVFNGEWIIGVTKIGGSGGSDLLDSKYGMVLSSQSAFPTSAARASKNTYYKITTSQSSAITLYLPDLTVATGDLAVITMFNFTCSATCNLSVDAAGGKTVKFRGSASSSLEAGTYEVDCVFQGEWIVGVTKIVNAS